MKRILLVLLALLVIIVLFVLVMDWSFRSQFHKLTDKIRGEAGNQDETIISENDLQNYPPPVARFIKASGLVGKKKISFMKVWHSGTFKLSRDKDFMPITGEYFLSTKKPSFTWLGKISMFPGFFVTARDSYFEGKATW